MRTSPVTGPVSCGAFSQETWPSHSQHFDVQRAVPVVCGDLVTMMHRTWSIGKAVVTGGFALWL